MIQLPQVTHRQDGLACKALDVLVCRMADVDHAHVGLRRQAAVAGPLEDLADLPRSICIWQAMPRSPAGVIATRWHSPKVASTSAFEQPTRVAVRAGPVRLHPAVVGAGGLAAPLGLPLHQRLHVGGPELWLCCPFSGVARRDFVCHITWESWRKVAHPVGAGAVAGLAARRRTPVQGRTRSPDARYPRCRVPRPAPGRNRTKGLPLPGTGSSVVSTTIAPRPAFSNPVVAAVQNASRFSACQPRSAWRSRRVQSGC